MEKEQDEEKLLRSVAFQNAKSILVARQKAEEALRESEERLRRTNAELAQRVAELREMNQELQDSRRAALNVMEEALQAREALRESEERLQGILRQATVGIAQTDLIGHFLLVNDRFCQIVGRPREEVLRLRMQDITHPDDLEKNIVLFQQTVQTAQDFVIEKRYVRPDGSFVWVHNSVYAVRGADDRPVHIVAVSLDITDRKEAEEAKARLAAIVESSSDAIISKDLDGIITSWNRGAERLFGYTAQEAAGQSITMLIPPDRLAEEPDILERIRRGEWIEHYETVRRRKDGTLLDISLTVSPIIDAQGTIVGASKIARDITDRKQTEAALQRFTQELEKRVADRTKELHRANAVLLQDLEERRKLEVQLLQAQKMESIGTLAGGIAHDFNNILNIIQGYAFILRAHGAQNREVSESLKVIDETIQRGTALAQQLLTLGRKTEVKFEAVDVNRLIEGLIELVKQTFAKTIELSLDLAPHLPLIMVDGNQFGQALLNLAVNARDAMPKGGRLLLRTSVVDGAGLRHLGEVSAERYVCIEVADTGVGMDEGVKQRIFEPFFTTKEIGRGTGLGLSVVYGIMKNHSGLINVESKPMSGSSFGLYFPIPLSEKSTQGPVATRDAEITAPSNVQATVLLVEDEEHMLHLLDKTLSRHGYRVLKASDGETAIKTYQRHKQSIDIVLLDIGLPKTAGRDVLLKVKHENPNAKIVVTSGYLEPELKSEIDRAGVTYFLQKPYPPNEVIKTFQMLIEKES